MEFAISQKWSDYHETYSKHIGWTLGLKCDHQPWPWSWIFKVKYGICYMYISTKSGPVAMKQKANISIEPQASNMTNGFDLGHDLNFWIFKVKCDLNLWPHAWPWPRIFMVKFWNSCISEWVGWLTLNKGGGSKSFTTMSLTIWWPRSGVRSDNDLDDFRCGQPLTHLALLLLTVSHYFKSHLLRSGLPHEYVNFQATSSMSPYGPLWWPRTAINNVV